MDEALTWIVLVVAVAIIGFLFGMFALQGVKGAAESKTPVPRFPGLTPEQTFGLGGVVLMAGGLLLVVWH
ncbi:hypothetical protein [Dongia sp. agr-C8]